VSAGSEPLPVCVLGAGYLGSRHAACLAAAPSFVLRSVYDRDASRAETLAARLGCEAAPTPEAALEGVEAAVVATSTSSHREAALLALEAGRHVLVEKPVTGRIEDAEVLVAAARRGERVLHAGYVERFNPAIRGLLGRVPAPRFVESHRLASLVPRNLDLDVVQDLMVHDLDLAIAFVGEEPHTVDAMGVAVVTDRVDIANARLRFPGGAVANLTASRVSRERVRKFRMFLPGTYVSTDCAAGKGDLFRLKPGHREELARAFGAGNPVEMRSLLEHEVLGEAGADALTAEHEAFRLAVRGESNPGVTGEDALRTLRAMVAVAHAIEAGLRGT